MNFAPHGNGRLSQADALLERRNDYSADMMYQNSLKIDVLG